ncbi:NAD(P)-dependent oxidoreductase [Sinobaca sp. H24]|uniref:NAD(P)-dependent oxidoreductase n=1 Tax=Sinobaca sp. H24 TaxID=2923376 RepID=UPI00207A078C|nr:NAD(P)-binding domain-containing protein [Sinobaca sp. H24]
MNISFIGLGIMGLPMAQHLQEKGDLFKVYNRTKKKADIFKETDVEIADSPKAAAEGADIVIVIVSDSADVKEVVLGEQGVIHGIKKDAIVVDMSSINPEVTKEIGGELEKSGAHLVDAPVSGGEKGAQNAALAIMCGGESAHIEKVKPYLDVMGKSVVHVGELGSGGYAKLANQVIVAIELQAVSEAIYLAKQADLDIDALYEAIRHGLAGSNVLDQKIDNFKKETYDPGFKVKLHLKDMNNALQAAEAQGITLPITSELQKFMKEMTESGLEELDHSALYQYLTAK